MTLSSADLTRLEAASRLLVSPLAAPDPTAWLAEAGDAVRALTGGERVILQQPGPVPYFSVDAPDVAAHMMSYVQSVGAGAQVLDPVVMLWRRLRREQNVGAFTWDINQRMVETRGHLIAKSPILMDALQGNGCYDYTGFKGYTAEGESMIWVLHGAHGSLGFGERTADVLNAILPSFQAGLDTLARFGAQRSALDAVAEPLSVFSPDGTEIHRNAALAALLAADPERLRVERQVAVLGRSAGRLPGAPVGLPVTATVETARGRYTLRVSALPPGLFGSDPTALVSVAADAAPALPDATTVRARLGLTRREAEVALLLAEGLTNAAIAERLFVSPHTARHHVENALGKLGLTSRDAVASRLMQTA